MAGKVQARFPAPVSSLSRTSRPRSSLFVVGWRTVAVGRVQRRRRRRWPGARRTSARRQPPSRAARFRRVVGQLLRRTTTEVRSTDAGRSPPPAVSAAQSFHGHRQRHAPVCDRQCALLAGENWRRSVMTADERCLTVNFTYNVRIQCTPSQNTAYSYIAQL